MLLLKDVILQNERSRVSPLISRSNYSKRGSKWEAPNGSGAGPSQYPRDPQTGKAT